MRKTYYNAASLRGSLDTFEETFGISSSDFHAAYVDYDEARMDRVPRYHRFSWDAFYVEWCRLSGEPCFAAESDLQTH